MGAWASTITREIKQDNNLLWLWKIIAWPVGLYLFFRFSLVRYTSKITVVAAPEVGPCIYVNWHRHLPFLIQHHGRYSRWLMVSKSPYVEPIALWCRLSGLKLVRGASKEGGTNALSELKKTLADGESVMLAVDGPAGPGFKVKRGCIELALATGLPIVPVSYFSKKGKEVKGRWDRMLVPRLFDSIQIHYGIPIYVNREKALEIVSKEVEIALNKLNSKEL